MKECAISPAAHAGAHFNLGITAAEAGDIAAAEAEWRATIASDEAHANAHLNLGISLLGTLNGALGSSAAQLEESGRAVEEAVGLLTRATRLDPDVAAAHFYLGKVK